MAQEMEATLIATLIPSDTSDRAVNAFCHQHNKDRYLPPRDVGEGRALSSRETTPVSDELIDERHKYRHVYNHRLVLNLYRKVKNPSKGFCFGANREVCDILLGTRGQGISNAHFYITIGTFNGKKRLILKDVSTRGMAVAYSGQAQNEIRDHFTWILDLEKDDGKWEVEVIIRGIHFKVELASHESCASEDEEKVEEFLNNEPALDGLAIYTPTEPATPSLVPRLPIYIRDRELGHGSFGSVHKVIDVSTGEIYARKSFYEPRWERSEKRRERQKEEWLSRVHRGIRIMKENQHENIVRVVDDREDSPPFLVMPYFPLGNLQDVHSEKVLSEQEAVDLLYQALNALQYLHARGVAHRDLKPENILVESRSPLSIKLADFGLANDKTNLETICGTPLYVAPEVCRHDIYTPAVDLWSLGVIILGYVYGLPDKNPQKSQNQYEAWGLAWCCRVVAHADDFDSDALLDLLTTGMLQMKPDQRLSASACLTKGHDMGLFSDQAHDSEDDTPRRQSALLSVASDNNSITTIVFDALWNMGDGNSRQDSESGIGCIETMSTFRRGSKRLRSPAVNSENSSSRADHVKRRPPEHSSAELHVERTGEMPIQFTGHDDSSQGKTVDTISSITTTSSAEIRGLTYPSALLDCTNVSGCSIPAEIGRSAQKK